jgi:dipeptidyl aminopeptidase/acylaminoacyl peptidase
MYEHGDAMWIESTEQRGEQMGGSPWQYRDRYIENSPFFYLDRVQTPLLIIHGEDDHPGTWIEATFVGLRRLGKDAIYAKYKGEGHEIEGHANRLDSTNRVLAWFDKYLKTEPSETHSAVLPQQF